MFVVLGATGNTGRVVATTLLAQGKPVRVVVRDAGKGQPWRDEGAEVAIADVDDREALQRAFRGADAAYVLLPPAFDAKDIRADNARRAKNVAAAIEATGVAHVAMLSSAGAQHAAGTGPVASLHEAEAVLGAAAPAATFLRPAYFVENWVPALAAVAQGVLPTFLHPDRAMAMVGTLDIGRAAARVLVEGPRGKRVVQLAGPREYAPSDIAAAVARIVGAPVVAQHVPEEAIVPTMRGAGMGADLAALYAELVHALNIGRIAWQDEHPLWRGETSVDTILAPFLGKAR